MTGKYLITTDAWFIAPDGKTYRAVWGDVEIVNDSFLGINTNRNSTNWFARIGTTDNHVIVAGCQIHYAVRCEVKPNVSVTVPDYNIGNDGINNFSRPSQIYIAE